MYHSLNARQNIRLDALSWFSSMKFVLRNRGADVSDSNMMQLHTMASEH